jgi:oxygen-independent coproporphyrinogen-3 oxidase
VTGEVPRPPVALYVHVPFCVSLCPYCDFVVYSGAETRGPRARVGAFIAAVATELRLRADALDRRLGPPGSADRPRLGSVYLGGGTPSLLAPTAVAGLLDVVRQRWGLAPGAEITLEANPGPDERGDAKAWREIGVTRLSIGAQSLDATELRRLGRRHRPEDVVDAIDDARAARIGSIGFDLLYDVPGQTPRSWRSTLEAAIDLRPDHLSLYALTLDDPDAEGLSGPVGDHLPIRSGARHWRDRARLEQDDDRAADAYEHATATLASAGYIGYEISNWARPGHASRHNLAYWQRRPHEAVGPGAHAFDGTTRRWNAGRLDGYLAALAPAGGGPPRLPPGGSEAVDERTADAERVILGLRLAAGVPAGWAERPPLDRVASWALSAGLLEEVDDRLRLTVRGRLLSNEVFARLL